jgi:hypothetical protein
MMYRHSLNSDNILYLVEKLGNIDQKLILLKRLFEYISAHS